jgi:dihydroneopterin aldolase
MLLQQLSLSCRQISLAKLRLNCQSMIVTNASVLSQPNIVVDINAYVNLDKNTPIHDALHEVFDYNLLRNIAHEIAKNFQARSFAEMANAMLERMLALPTVKAVLICLQPEPLAQRSTADAIETIELFKINPNVE